MKVLMFGWEFPPFISGGLGTACYGLTKAMTQLGAEVIFVLPQPVEASHSSHVTLLTPEGPVNEAPEPDDRIRILGHDAGAYARPNEATPTPQRRRVTGRIGTAKAGSVVRSHYGGNLFNEVDSFAREAVRIVEDYDFDIIHAHDWLTYKAAMAVQAAREKPLIVHVHSTEFDRGGDFVNPRIFAVEREGMQRATHVVAVSKLTKRVVTRRYGIPPEKVTVVYNAMEIDRSKPVEPPSRVRGDEKIVLFLGRITMQKGPEFFVAAAKKVLQRINGVKFVMAGSGDLAGKIIEMAAREGVARRMLFTGFLRGKQVEQMFRAADLFVMPSVSEPFGLVPLEALSYGVPVIISKQSGVSEILQNALKVDFWDVDRMADLIVAVLRNPALHAALRENGARELERIRWEDPARDCLDLYGKLVANGS